MKILGVCTKSVSEVYTKLSEQSDNIVILKTHKKDDKDYSKFNGYILCPDYFIFKSWYEYLNTKATVIVFGNLLFLSEIVHIEFLDVIKSNNNSSFVSKPINYDEIISNDYKDISIKNLSHLKHTAHLQNKNIKKDKFFKLFNSFVLYSNVGVDKNKVEGIVFGSLLGTKTNLSKELSKYANNNYSKKLLDNLLSFISKKEVCALFNELKTLKDSKQAINYSKLENKELGITKQGLKLIVKEYNMIKNGKYNMVALDLYNDLTHNKTVSESEE